MTRSGWAATCSCTWQSFSIAASVTHSGALIDGSGADGGVLGDPLPDRLEPRPNVLGREAVLLLEVLVRSRHPEALDAEWCDRLLNIPAKAAGATSVSGEVNGQLDELIAQQHAATLEEIETRNGKYFEEQVDKRDRWAEDVKLTLERELKELDAEIRAARKDSKTKVVLADKLEAQRRIKTLEQRRNGKRRQLFDAQDDVDKKRTQLIEDIERQLKTSAERETLFTIRWVLPEASCN